LNFTTKTMCHFLLNRIIRVCRLETFLILQATLGAASAA